MQDTLDSVLSIRNLRKNFNATQVLRGIDLDISSGETVAVIGPSGSGKSTMLRCLNCLDVPDGGSVWLEGELVGFEPARSGYRRMNENVLAKQRKKIGMVFQSFNLFPHWTVLQNLIYAPMKVRGMSKADATKQARRLLERVGLGDREGSYPRRLSGGQQQRVAIARALAMQPKLLLFDEPTSALDPANVGEVTNVMSNLSESGSTMVVVTHELSFARATADRVVFMKDGTIVEQGTAKQIIDKPTEKATQEFIANTLA